jgi:hypothetical protein
LLQADGGLVTIALTRRSAAKLNTGLLKEAAPTADESRRIRFLFRILGAVEQLAPHLKAPEGWRTPRRFATFRGAASMRQLVECGSPCRFRFVDPGTTDTGYNGGRSSCVAETGDPGSAQSGELSMLD